MIITFPGTKYRVEDPAITYPIFAIEVMAENAFNAQTAAMEAMFGCPVDEVSEQVVADFRKELKVTPL